MVVKQVSDLHLFAVRDAAKGFIISLSASNRYAPGYLDVLEESLGLMTIFAEAQDWPPINRVTTAHVEDYLSYLLGRRRWFGEQDAALKPLSQSYVETQYRRLKRFWGWLVSRGHVEANALDLIPHPHIDEKIVPIVTQEEMMKLLMLTDMKVGRTAGERFRMVRNRAVLYLFWDTPARKNELSRLTIESIDIDGAGLVVFGKGRRERWMPLGSVALEALWDYMQLRSTVAKRHSALWVAETGKAMGPEWIRIMLRRLGEDAGVPGLHAHRFRHTYAVNALRAGMPERLLMLNGGWKKIPETYFRTLGFDDVARKHREISPADKLWQTHENGGRRRPSGKTRGRL